MNFLLFDAVMIGIIKYEYSKGFHIWKSPVIKNKINIDFFGYAIDIAFLPKNYVKNLRVKIALHNSDSESRK